MSPLRVELFGGFQLLSAGEPIRPPASRAARSLLAYLLLNRDRAHARVRLVGMFWPEETEASGRRKLSQNLWRIRQVLEPVGYGDLIKSDADDLSIAESCEVELDVDDFYRGIAHRGESASESSIRDLLSAVELYRGELLYGFYDDWVLEEQRRVAEDYVHALSRLVSELKANGSTEEALIYARKLTWQNPLREEAHRDVMRLCRLLNRPAEALRQYEQLEELLYEEFGAEPEPETRALFDEIAQLRHNGSEARSEGPVEPYPDIAPFIGRQAERALAIDAIDQTIGGRGSVVLVEGEPGSGKSRFLDEIAKAAAWRGVDVLRGSARSGSTVPFGVIRDTLLAGMTELRAAQLEEQVDPLWLAEVTRVVPQLVEWLPDIRPVAPLRSPEGRDRIIEALTIVLAAFGRITPHVIIFDDLHAADADSIEVVRRLANSPSIRRASMFVAFRSMEGRARDDVWGTLRELDRGGGTIVSMQPLESREVEQLVRWAAADDRATVAAADRIHRDTGGNPLFVIETTRALVETGGWDSERGLPVTADVRKVIAERLDRLTDVERELLSALAVRGGAATTNQLFQWCEVGKTDLLQSLIGLINRRLVVESGTGYEFVHDHWRRVAYDLTLPEDRARFHRVIAQTLELDEFADPAVLAYHLRRAGFDERAFAHWLRAARDAASIHAYATAAELYEAALECLRPGDQVPERIDALAEYEAVLATVGRRDAQRAILDAWLEAVAEDEPRAIEAQIRLATFLARSDEYELAITLATNAAERAGRLGFSIHRALLVAGRARHYSGDTGAALDLLARAAAQAPGDIQVALAYGGVLGEALRYEEARSQLSRALEFSRAAGDRLAEAEALGLLALVSVELGDGADAIGAFQTAISACESIGYTAGRALNQSNAGLALYGMGQIADALESFTEARRTFEAIGRGRGAALAANNEAMIRHLVLGDDQTAWTLLESSLRFFEESGYRGGQAHCRQLLGSIAHAAGDEAGAGSFLASAIDLAERSGNHRRRAYALATRASAHLDLGRFEAALDDVRSAQLDAPADLEVRLAAYEARIGAATGDAGAWELSQQAHQADRAGLGLAWEIPYLHGIVAETLGRTEEAEHAFAEAHMMLRSALAGLDRQQQRDAITMVPMHADIEARWSVSQPLQMHVTLADRRAPLGRPLRPDELVEVDWVLDRDFLGTSPAERRRGIVELAGQASAQGALPTIDDLAAALSVSRATIKRDLSVLRSHGTAPRTRGTRNLT